MPNLTDLVSRLVPAGPHLSLPFVGFLCGQAHLLPPLGGGQAGAAASAPSSRPGARAWFLSTA